MNIFDFNSNINLFKQRQDKNELAHYGTKAKSISHAGLNNMKNYNYYQKIDDFYGPGRPRYFYSKEEWDAYNSTKDKKPEYSINETTGKMIKNNPDGSTSETSVTWDQFRNGSIMEADQKIERTLKESGMSAGIKAMMRDERIQEMLTQFEGGFENHGWDFDENGKVTGLSDDDKKYFKKMGQWMRKFKDSNGDYLFDSKEFQDALNDEIHKRYDTIKDQKEQESKTQEKNKKASEETSTQEVRTKKITNKLTKLSEGGNVDLNNRPEISTKELEKAGWNDVGEGYATVFSSTYSNENEDTFYNFTPIIVDPKTGKFLGVMSPKEFEQYCYDVIDGKRKDDKNLQIGGAFTGEDALKNAEKAAKKIHELHEELSELNKSK